MRLIQSARKDRLECNASPRPSPAFPRPILRSRALILAVVATAAIAILRPIAASPPPPPTPPVAGAAADPQPFAPAPFRLEAPHGFARDEAAALEKSSVRILLPIGPVRIEYGIPLSGDPSSRGGRFNFHGDFPGPGYRQQRAMPNRPVISSPAGNAAHVVD